MNCFGRVFIISQPQHPKYILIWTFPVELIQDRLIQCIFPERGFQYPTFDSRCSKIVLQAPSPTCWLFGVSDTSVLHNFYCHVSRTWHNKRSTLWFISPVLSGNESPDSSWTGRKVGFFFSDVTGRCIQSQPIASLHILWSSFVRAQTFPARGESMCVSLPREKQHFESLVGSETSGKALGVALCTSWRRTVHASEAAAVVYKLTAAPCCHSQATSLLSIDADQSRNSRNAPGVIRCRARKKIKRWGFLYSHILSLEVELQNWPKIDR